MHFLVSQSISGLGVRKFRRELAHYITAIKHCMLEDTSSQEKKSGKMPGRELYFVDSKPPAVCYQILLEFFIFVIAALLWLTWCTQHVRAKNDLETKSLAFSLPGYIEGWICLMISRLFGSRLKEKFCFSFYLASGIRFMTSAAILYPEFTNSWFPVAYGLIALLCFITTIFHIVTQHKPERRQVRRLIRPDGTLEKKPVNDMMTLKQLETYKDAIRNYIEKQDNSEEDDEPYYVKSVSVITVRLNDCPCLESTDDLSICYDSLLYTLQGNASEDVSEEHPAKKILRGSSSLS